MSRGALAALVLLAACAPEPRWIAVASDSTRQLVLFHHELGTADTVSLDAALAATAHVVGLTAGADGFSLYLSVQDGRSARLIRLRRDGARLDDVSLPGDSIGPVVLLPNGRTLVAATTRDGDSATVTFLPITLTPRGREIAVCPSTIRALQPFAGEHRLYVACGDGEIAELDTRLQVLLQVVPLPPPAMDGTACEPADLTLSENQTTLFVLCRHSGHVLYLDRVRLAPFDSADVGTPVTALVRPVGRDVLLALAPVPPSALVFAPRRRATTARFDLPEAPVAADVGPDGRRAYILAGSGGATELLMLDLAGRDGPSHVALAAGSVGPVLWPRRDSPVMRWER